MNTDNEMLQQESPAPQKTKIPKAVWYIGCGCLALAAAVIVIALAIFGYMYFFGGKDPITEAIPGDSLVYVNMDFLQSQSPQFNKIVPIIQGIAEVEKQPLVDALDQAMKDELDMSFKDEVMPWMGQHGGFVITDGDFDSGDIQFMFIMETRNKNLTDAFLLKFVAALENKNGMTFEQKVVDGVTFFVDDSASGSTDGIVIARSGKLVYLSNSEDDVLNSINIKSGDSLAKSGKYKDALAALPKNYMTSVYINGDVTSKYLSTLSNDLGAPQMDQFMDDSVSAFALSMSVQNEGLRFDIATTYDETKLNDYLKESLNAKHLNPNADKLVPDDTIFFLDINSTQNPASLTQTGNPLYTKDIEEAFDLFEKQYNVSIPKLLELLGGEFALAIGPSTDGPLSTLGEVDLGVTIFASTKDEAGGRDWLKDALNAVSKEASMQLTTDEVKIGDYQLQEVSTEGFEGPILLYGAGNGYMVLGTSQDVLEGGLNGSGTLANNAAYKETWKAFPSNSVPYVYLNVSSLLDFYASNSAIGGDLGSAEADWKKILTLAGTANNVSGYARSVTLIVFIDTKK